MLDRKQCCSIAAALLPLLPFLLSGAAAQPAPAVGAAPAPSPDVTLTCDCNPAVQAVSGTCSPFRLPTPWSCGVDPSNPLPEYPRPQLTRPNYQSLNGIWEWERADTWDSGPVPVNRTLLGSIVVPFPVEGDLSGLSPENKTGVFRMWYRRTFKIPREWKALEDDNRIILHFGAVDWESQVWVNGQHMGMHRGGYDKFSYDITDALTNGTDGRHELIVGVYDPTEYAHIPLGKQRHNVPSIDIFYTATSGIWQTVWLEPVNAAHITRLNMIPDIDNSALQVTVLGSNSTANLPVQVAVYMPQDGSQVASGKGVMASPFNVTIPNPRLWSPGDPFLYDVRIRVLGQTAGAPSAAVASRKAMPFIMQESSDNVLDEVMSYTGMRKVSLGKSTPMSPLRIFLNNEPFLGFGPLDQGYHPDGIYTAANDDALKFDIEAMKGLGMNLIRKHVKVEPDRWYYHADRLGMLVWQDMVAMFWEKPYMEGERYRTPLEKAQFEAELRRMVEEHHSNPCIGIYTVFNEGWGQYETQRVVQEAKALDPSRLWDAASGWIDPQDETAYPPGNQTDKSRPDWGINKEGPWVYHYVGYVGDLRDDHNYPDAIASGATSTRANVAGEFGGLGMFIDGHMWKGRNQVFSAYPLMDNTTELQSQFLMHLGKVKDLMKSSAGVSAAIYTQNTDVEDETSGIYTYDRKVLKFPDPEAVVQQIRDLVSMPVD
ncbi:probable beta-glucuronidase [Coccomyxa sp. Obi]|nr:probable beta-glucuronidase [Coccomyxa sp. Obi]